MSKLVHLIIGALSAVSLASGTLAQPAYHAPRTSFGDPDLQGLWTNASITTLERPPGITSLVITPAEAARLEKANKAWLADNDKPTDPKKGAPPAGDDPGGKHRVVGVVEGDVALKQGVERRQQQFGQRCRQRHGRHGPHCPHSNKLDFHIFFSPG